MMNSTPDDPAAHDREPTATVAPEEEKRENLQNEPSAAQAVKNAAADKLRPATDPTEPKGELMGLDAPGFGDRSAENGDRTTSSGTPDAMAREEATVDAEFDGMDNDLIDMGDFGEGGTGSGTQTGGAGERLRPTGIAAQSPRSVEEDRTDE